MWQWRLYVILPNARFYSSKSIGLTTETAGRFLRMNDLLKKFAVPRRTERWMLREQPGLRKLTSAFDPEEVIAAVTSVYNIHPSQIIERRGCHREARRAAIYCTDKFCRALHTQSEMAKLLNIGLGAYGSAISRFEHVGLANSDLDRTVNEVKKNLKTNMPEVTPACHASLGIVNLLSF
jgi:hypothetical protein